MVLTELPRDVVEHVAGMLRPADVVALQSTHTSLRGTGEGRMQQGRRNSVLLWQLHVDVLLLHSKVLTASSLIGLHDPPQHAFETFAGGACELADTLGWEFVSGGADPQLHLAFRKAERLTCGVATADVRLELAGPTPKEHTTLALCGVRVSGAALRVPPDATPELGDALRTWARLVGPV